MSQKLYLVVTVKINIEHRDFIKREMAKLVAETQKEEGCKKYIVLEDNKNLDTFIFYEKWESYDLWQKHLTREHIAKYREATDDKIFEKTIHELSMANIF